LRDILGKKNVQSVAEIEKLAQATDKLRQYTSDAKREVKTLSQAEQSYAMQSQTANAAATRLGNQWQLFAESVGKTLQPILGTLQRLAGAFLELGRAIFDAV